MHFMPNKGISLTKTIKSIKPKKPEIGEFLLKKVAYLIFFLYFCSQIAYCARRELKILIFIYNEKDFLCNCSLCHVAKCNG